MLTPKFEFSQSDEKLFISIHAPNVKPENSEYILAGCHFYFHGKPYYLHLKLPGNVLSLNVAPGFREIVDDKQVISFYKAVKGEHFKNLDKVSLFIVHSKAGSLDSAGDSDSSSSDVPCEETAIEMKDEEEFEQMQCEGASALPQSVLKCKYGFGNHFYNAFLGLKAGLVELLDLHDPDGTPKSSCSNLKAAKEFSDYKKNSFQNNVEVAILNYKTLWQNRNYDFSDSLTDAEFYRLKAIPNNIWSKDTRKFIYLGAVDILLAFCYDNRTTKGEPTSESARTINKVSSTLSWLEKFKSVEAVIISFMKRSLCYPKYRSWNLSRKVVADVESLLRCNKLLLQKYFLQIHALFNDSVPRYMLNRIYIDDYCHWIGHADERVLRWIAREIAKVKLHKDDVEFYFRPLEMAVLGVPTEYSEPANAFPSIVHKLRGSSITEDSDNLSTESSVRSEKGVEADDEEF